MNAHPSSDAIARINRELHRAAAAEHALPIAAAGSALAISDACSAFRRIRADLDDYVPWLEAHMRELVPLMLMLIQIADAACRVHGGARR